MFGAIADLFKHGHDQSVGRAMDIWQTNYVDRKIQNRTAELNKNLWTYQMNNSYQLSVDDMRKAGLNPMLMMSNGATSVGGHASSPSGYSGRKDSNWMPSQSLVAAKQLGVLESQEEKNKAEASLLTANAKSAKSQAYINGLIEKAFRNNKDLANWQALKDVLPTNVYQLIASLAGYGVMNKPQSPTPQPKPNRAQGNAGRAVKSMEYSDSR